MITWLSLVCASLAVFLAYNITALCIFGVPSSLSNTYYLYEAKMKHLGMVFPAMMASMAFTLLPAWLELGEIVSLWSAYLNPLAFFACAAILFVGGAPAFRSNRLEGTVHEVAAKIAAAAALIPALRPKTIISSNELPIRRFSPWIPPTASPATKRFSTSDIPLSAILIPPF